MLVDQLGIEPGPALQELEKSILRQDPGLGIAEIGNIPAVESSRAQRAVLVAVLDEARLDALIGLAEPLVRRPSRELILARLIGDDFELGPAAARLHERRADLAERGVVARATVFTSGQPGSDLARLTSEQDIDLILLDAPPTLLEKGLPDADLAAVLAGAPCDVGLLVVRPESARDAVLVPFGGVEHDWAAVELGAWIARSQGAPLRLAGAAAVPSAGKRDASRLLSHASLAVERVLGVSAEPLLVPPGVEGVLEASRDAGLLVVGLSSRWHHEGLGPARLRIAREALPPTLLVRRGLRPGGLAPPVALTRFTWSIGAV
jgi:hypothetical protein